MPSILTIPTQRSKQVVDLTDRLNRLIREADFQAGLCSAFCLHTTAALTPAALDPGTDLDMLDAYTAMIPKLQFRHPHDPSHTPDHILAALIGPGLSLPVVRGRLLLGTWQRVVLFEFDGPRERQVSVSLVAAE